MASPEARGNSGKIQRSYLFITMILLVWNVAATARHWLPDVSSPSCDAPEIRPLLHAPASTTSVEEAEANPKHAPLTVYQKYHLNKRIDINKALKKEISSLPGITDSVAEAVIAERERIGGFRSPEDLLRVKGIKEKRLKKILPFLLKMENN